MDEMKMPDMVELLMKYCQVADMYYEENDEIKKPSIEELAEIVYKYCKTNNITYIREDELFKKILDERGENLIKTLTEKYNIEEDSEIVKDKELMKEITNNILSFSIFNYTLSKCFFDIIDILIDQCKADREKKDGERLYYLKFYIHPLIIDSIKIARSNIEIFAKELYNYCKENNIQYLIKELISTIINVQNTETIDEIIEFLIKKNMASRSGIDNITVLYLEENQIELRKNLKSIIKNTGELLLNYCHENNIKYLEKEKLMNIMELDDDGFEQVLEYLVERHLADVEDNPDDGKIYIRVCE